MSACWSPVIVDVEPLVEAPEGSTSPALAVPGATVWRRATGFAERAGGSGLVAGFSVRNLVRWFARDPLALRLQLVLEVGGSSASAAWLGLTAIGHDEASARARLAPFAEDLAEALDVYGLFTEIPRRGPRMPPRVSSLSCPQPSAASARYGESGLLPMLARLHRLPDRVVLAMELRPSRLDTALLGEIDRQRSAAELGNTPPSSPRFGVMLMMDDFDPQARIREQLDTLWESAHASELRIAMHGRPPRSLLLTTLEECLGADLGAEARFVAGPPVAITGWHGALQSLIGPVIGAAQSPDAARREAEADDVPF